MEQRGMGRRERGYESRRESGGKEGDVDLGGGYIDLRERVLDEKRYQSGRKEQSGRGYGYKGKGGRWKRNVN